jgi:hypothetical protein
MKYTSIVFLISKVCNNTFCQFGFLFSTLKLSVGSGSSDNHKNISFKIKIFLYTAFRFSVTTIIPFCIFVLKENLRIHFTCCTK